MSKKKPEELNEKRGAKPIVDQKIILSLEQAFSIGANDEEACLHAGIGTSTLYNYQNKYPEFVERKNLLKRKQVLKAKQNIAVLLDQVDKDITKWILERKAKGEYSTQQILDIKGSLKMEASQAEMITKLKELLTVLKEDGEDIDIETLVSMLMQETKDS